jgi:hypothetical protein
MQRVTVIPIAAGASPLGLRTAVCRTVPTRNNVPTASNLNAPPEVMRCVDQCRAKAGLGVGWLVDQIHKDMKK